MILLFGGTTEGIKAGKLLDFLGEPYFYSTKEQSAQKVKGKFIIGEMNELTMKEFCVNNDVQIIIDAGHPFAEKLHEHIYQTSTTLNIPSIRYDRESNNLSDYDQIELFNSFQELSNAALLSNVKTILALTGVNSIPVLKELWMNKTCYFRILNKHQSYRKAMSFNFPEKNLIMSSPSENVEELVELGKNKNAELILTKETGSNGFLDTKIKAAEILDIPVWVIKRPALPSLDYTINSEKELLKRIYYLRRTVFKQKPNLRLGYSTGTCVTAAARACFFAIVENQFPDQTQVELPDGETARFLIFSGQKHSDKEASCVVIKDAGDDPDVTHAKEIGCTLSKDEVHGIEFVQGEGVGLVTLNGLELQVGEPAINPVPRQMIKNMLYTLAQDYGVDCTFRVKPFMPEGREIAKKTFNSRVGIKDGLSILGTTGKVIPYSREAFQNSIKQQLSALQHSCESEVVMTSGKRGEKMIREQFQYLPDIAFIHFGNSIGETLKMLQQYRIKNVNVALMFGKSIKLAEGYLDTHSKRASFNPEFAASIAKDCNYPYPVIQKIKNQSLANQILDILPFEEYRDYYTGIAKNCYQVCKEILPAEINLTYILLSANGDRTIVSF